MTFGLGIRPVRAIGSNDSQARSGTKMDDWCQRWTMEKGTKWTGQCTKNAASDQNGLEKSTAKTGSKATTTNMTRRYWRHTGTRAGTKQRRIRLGNVLQKRGVKQMDFTMHAKSGEWPQRTSAVLTTNTATWAETRQRQIHRIMSETDFRDEFELIMESTK